MQSSRAHIEHVIGKLKNFKFLSDRRYSEIDTFEMCLDAVIALHNAWVRADALELLKVKEPRRGPRRHHLKPKKHKEGFAGGAATAKKDRPAFFNDFHQWVCGRAYLADGAALEAKLVVQTEAAASPATRETTTFVKLRPVAVKRALNSVASANFCWLEVERLPNGAGYIVCGHVACSFMDDCYKVYALLTEAGVEGKVCACSQGENGCSHYGNLLEVLKQLRSDPAGANVQVRKRRPATPLEKLKKLHLSKIFREKLVQKMAARIPVAKEPLSRPYERVYCVCREARDQNDMLQCEDCAEWYHPKCVGLHDEIDEDMQQQWRCGFCEAWDDADEDQKLVFWDVERYKRTNGKTKRFQRAAGDEPATLEQEEVHLGGYNGPKTWKEAVEAAKTESARLRKKTKNYKESAEGMAERHQKEGTGHHTVDRAVGGGGGTTRSPMTPDLVQHLNEDE